MDSMFGADVSALRGFAQKALARSHDIDTRLSQLHARVESLPWVGADRERFLAEWSDHHASLAELARDLADAGRRAFRHADDQERASGSGLGGGGGGGW
jgi:uncharacterized protein YukE